MAALSIVTHQLKEQLKRHVPTLLRVVGLSLLNQQQTQRLLQPFQLRRVEKDDVSLDEVIDPANPQKVLFAPKMVKTEPDFVWKYHNNGQTANVLRSGLVQIGNKILNTDFGNNSVLSDLLKPDRRPVVNHPLVIAPWSHYWPGYFDFLIFVVAKIARMKRATDPVAFNNAVITYPLLQTTFEREWYSLLGIQAAQLVDSRTHKVSFDECLIGNNSSWFYPSADDLLALQAIVLDQLPAADQEPTTGRRLYISRKARRQVINEAELVAMLARYGFEVIEDRPRSVLEQLTLYRSASFILGPHGASFGNLIACRPGTQFMELFPPNYMPEYFRYMAKVLNLRYAAYCLGEPTSDRDNHANVKADLSVSVDELERGLVRLLNQSTH